MNKIKLLQKNYDVAVEKFELKKEAILKREEEKHKDNPELFFKNWDIMLKETAIDRLFLRKLRYKIEEVTEVIWENIPDYGDQMTMKHFKENCDAGGFIDYDGSGSYASKTKMSNIGIVPSDFKRGTIHKNKEFTHIIWFNR